MYAELHNIMYNYNVSYVLKIIMHTGNNSEVVITTKDYQPGEYSVTFNFTDIYGQRVQQLSHLFLMCMFIFNSYKLIWHP